MATDNVECKSHAVSKFRYFVLENSIILALFEEPLGNDQGLFSSFYFIIKTYKTNYIKSIIIFINQMRSQL